MNSSDCLICFYPIESNQNISCGNPDCSASICYECAKVYIIHSENEKEIPKCPSPSCRHEYLYSMFKQIDDESKTRYINACYEYFTVMKSNDIDDTINHERMIEKLRKERKEFIASAFPKAISLTIEYALSSKMRKIDKQNRKKIKDIIDSTNKKCINLLCPGKLDTNYKCLTCDTLFCTKCEKNISSHTSTHVCDPNDIESLKFVQSLVKCPKCLYPVIRSYGCNYMTCSVCKTNFHYETGEITQAGNHHNASANIVTSLKPSERWRDYYEKDTNDISASKDILSLLKQLEAKAPQEETLTPIMRDLIKIKKYTFDNGEIEIDDISFRTTKEHIAKHFEKYKIAQYKYKEYYKVMRFIEEHHNNKTLTAQLISDIIGKITC